MSRTFVPGGTIIGLIILCLIAYIIVLIIKAVKKRINSKKVRTEKCATTKTLGQVLKNHRTNCKMTQEFVAESLGVSRQAVSKWESGASSPSTANLIALAKLFNIDPETLIKEANSN